MKQSASASIALARTAVLCSALGHAETGRNFGLAAIALAQP